MSAKYAQIMKWLLALLLETCNFCMYTKTTHDEGAPVFNMFFSFSFAATSSAAIPVSFAE